MHIFSEISLFWLIPIITISFIGGFWYYRNQTQLKDASKRLKYLLSSIRSLTLFLLFILLMGILIESKESVTEKPVFITVFDNSTSMLNYKDSSLVEKSILEYNAQLKEQYGDRFELINYGLDCEIINDSVVFGKKTSDLNKVYDFIYNQYYNRNIGGIALISDGNYNQGQNPLYTAEKIALTPMFVLSVGDTIQKRDQLIKTVSANQIAYLGNDFPVEVDFEAAKLANVATKLQVLKGGKIILEKEVKYANQNVDFRHEVMMMKADQLGFVQYTIRLVDLNNEASYVNNVKTIYVEVLDGRSKVIILANAPHPDVTAFKQILDKDDKLEVESKLFNEWNGKISDYQMVVVHGPHGQAFKSIANKIIESKKPFVLMVDAQTKQTDIDVLGVNLQFPIGQQKDEVQGYVRSEFQLFEVSESLKDMLEKAPPLQVPFGKITTKSGDVLISQRIGKVEKQDPLVFFGKNQRSKYAAFVGEGIWRWKLNEFSRTEKIDGLTELIQRSTQYLVTKDIREPFRVILPKRFDVLEDVLVGAEFYNEILKPIVTPEISFELKNEKGEKFDYSFAKKTTDYQLNLGKLLPGKYQWLAKTAHNGKKYSKQGEFIVEEINIEDLRTSADMNTLSQIAAVGDGELFELNSMNNFFKSLNKRKDIVNVTYEESDFNELIELLLFLVFLVLLLATEWFLRRYFGTY